MLHMLGCSPYQIDFHALLRNVCKDDAILLLQDGVIAGLAGTHYCGLLLDITTSIFVLLPDLLARGLSSQVADEIKIIDYNDFVALTVTYPKQIVW